MGRLVRYKLQKVEMLRIAFRNIIGKQHNPFRVVTAFGKDHFKFRLGKLFVLITYKHTGLEGLEIDSLGIFEHNPALGPFPHRVMYWRFIPGVVIGSGKEIQHSLVTAPDAL